MRSRSILCVILILLFGFTAGALFAAGERVAEGELELTEITIQYQPNTLFAVQSVALEKGWFEEAGFEKVNIKNFTSGNLAGEALIKADMEDEAVQVLEAGYRIAAGKGDLMPKDTMAELLRSIGREPPALPEEVKAQAEAVAASGAFVCKRTGRPGTQLPDPPFRGPVGQWIHENISAETWRDWLGQGTKVINELRLDLSREADQQLYDQHMCEYLGIDADLYAQLTS